MAVVVAVGVVRLGRLKVPQAIGTWHITKRDKSSTSLANYKRGRGGRSSFSGIVATVFGATGFLGHHVVNRLGKIGSQVIIPYRADPYEAVPLKLAGDLGQILFQPFHLQDEESIRKAMMYSNVVINLVGRDWETRNFKFHDVHVDGARRIARLAKECGVERLIHFSSLNASPDPQKIYIKNGSQFLKSKYEGEQAVREEFPDAIIFRPSDIYGPADRFCSYYANFWRRTRGNHIPLWKKGDATIKQPVFVFDVAQGVVNAIQNPDAVGKTFEAVGPSRYYLSDIIDFFYRSMRYRTFKRIHLWPTFRLKVMYMTYAPVNPVYTIEKIEKEHLTDVLTDCPTLEDLGVKLTRLEDRGPYELRGFRQFAYYDDQLGEFEDPAPPPIVA